MANTFTVRVNQNQAKKQRSNVLFFAIFAFFCG